jgi:hypothetical protein
MELCLRKPPYLRKTVPKIGVDRLWTEVVVLLPVYVLKLVLAGAEPE